MSLGSQSCDCTFLTKRTRRWSRRCFFNFFLLFVTVVHPLPASAPVISAQLGCVTYADGGHACQLDACAVLFGKALFSGGGGIPPISCLGVCNTAITLFMSCVTCICPFLISSISARSDRTSSEQAAAAMGPLGTRRVSAMRSLIACRRSSFDKLKTDPMSVFRFFGPAGLAAYACCSSQLCNSLPRG
jgi:hypothetical protein